MPDFFVSMAHHQISQHISHGIGSWLTATCGRIARQHKLLIASSSSSSENSKSTMVNSLLLQYCRPQRWPGEKVSVFNVQDL